MCKFSGFEISTVATTKAPTRPIFLPERSMTIDFLYKPLKDLKEKKLVNGFEGSITEDRQFPSRFSLIPQQLLQQPLSYQLSCRLSEFKTDILS
jgi:hypothetical protein